MANLDKDKLLEALRASIQNPKAGELLIHRVESGEFDVAAPKKAGKSEPAE